MAILYQQQYIHQYLRFNRTNVYSHQFIGHHILQGLGNQWCLRFCQQYHGYCNGQCIAHRGSHHRDDSHLSVLYFNTCQYYLGRQLEQCLDWRCNCCRRHRSRCGSRSRNFLDYLYRHRWQQLYKYCHNYSHGIGFAFGTYVCYGHCGFHLSGLINESECHFIWQ